MEMKGYLTALVLPPVHLGLLSFKARNSVFAKYKYFYHKGINPRHKCHKLKGSCI